MSIVIPYLLCLLLIFLFQRKIIYFPQTLTITEQKQLATDLQLELWPTEDEHYLGLISLHAPTQNRGTIIVFHGNAGSANGRANYRDALEKLGYRVILAEYPGYGAKAGSPSETTILAEANKTVQQVIKDFGGPIFLWGESLGTGTVAGVIGNQQFSIKGISLISPYDSLANIAQHHYWFFLAKWLLLDRFNNIKHLEHYNGKVAVIMAGEDEVIPNSATQKLYDSLSAQKKIWIFSDANHNTLPLAPDNTWWREVMDYLIDP